MERGWFCRRMEGGVEGCGRWGKIKRRRGGGIYLKVDTELKRIERDRDVRFWVRGGEKTKRGVKGLMSFLGGGCYPMLGLRIWSRQNFHVRERVSWNRLDCYDWSMELRSWTPPPRSGLDTLIVLHDNFISPSMTELDIFKTQLDSLNFNFTFFPYIYSLSSRSPSLSRRGLTLSFRWLHTKTKSKIPAARGQDFLSRLPFLASDKVVHNTD